MNAPSNIGSLSENRDELAYANAQRLADRAKMYADSLKDVASAKTRYIRGHLREKSELHRLQLLDALSHVFDSQAMEAGIASDMADIRHDLRIDEEGYPLNDEGDLLFGAERRFIPIDGRLVA